MSVGKDMRSVNARGATRSGRSSSYSAISGLAVGDSIAGTKLKLGSGKLDGLGSDPL